ncbi:phosphodiesterase YaeI [compost metagenome]
MGKDEFILLLAHTPDYAMNTMVHPISLQMSGHSHGGQVRLPFHGPLVRVPGAKRYPDGLYRPPNNEIFQLYTNRGVGVTGIPVRFWCRPELTIHTLV